MCIIMLDDRPKDDNLIPKDVLSRCQEKHPDGLGLMYGDGETLHMWKSLEKFDEFYERYAAARSEGHRVALHFRRTTKGVKSYENCHPFEIREGLGLMHNGTLHKLTKFIDKIDGINDTRFFVQEVLTKLPGDFSAQRPLFDLIDSYIGLSRLVVMDRLGRFTLFNPTSMGAGWSSLGQTGNKDIWVSNNQDQSYIFHGKTSVYTGNRGHGSGYSWPNQWGGQGYVPPNLPNVGEDVTKEHLVFFWGGMQDLVDSGRKMFDLKEDGFGYVPGTQLYSLSSEEFLDVDLPALVKLQSGDRDQRVYGRIYRLESPTKVALVREFQKLDDAMTSTYGEFNKSLFHRFHIPIEQKGIGTVWAWVYFVNSRHLDDYDMAPVPHGDWTAWEARQKEDRDPPPEDDDVLVLPFPKSVDEDPVRCPACHRQDVTPFNYTQVDEDGENYNGVWCNFCNDHYPLVEGLSLANTPN